MNGLQFIASLVETLAWPGLVGFLVWGFRLPLGKLLDRLASIKVDGRKVEAEFAREVAEVVVSAGKKIEESQDVIEALSVDEAPQTITLQELADVAPRAAVLESWIKIETATRDYLEAVDMPRRMSYQGLRRLPPEHIQPIEPILSTYQELRMLRNKAVHMQDADITSVVANDYIDAASNVVAVIRQATRNK